MTVTEAQVREIVREELAAHDAHKRELWAKLRAESDERLARSLAAAPYYRDGRVHYPDSEDGGDR